MSQKSSINFKPSTSFQVFHNSTSRPKYAIGGKIIANRNGYEALKLKEQIINQAIETYNEKKAPKAPKFKATSYEWSAVCNIKEDTTMQDLERLAEHFETKYGFQCYQIVIHRDEGHIDDNGEKVINHHAHLEFITLDKNTGKSMFRADLQKPKALSQIQNEVAKILKMERGVEKKDSKRKRIEPRIYAQMKEQERKVQKELKAEHKQELEAKDQTIQKLIQTQDQAIQELIQDQDQTIQELIQTQDQEIQKLEEELEEEKLSKAKLEAELEELRKNSKNQGFSKKYFQEINKEKKLLRFKTLNEFKKWVEELREKHTKKNLLSNKVNEEAVLKDIYKVYQEQDNTIQAQNAKIKDLEAEKEQFNELLKADPALKKAWDCVVEALKNKNKPKTKEELYSERRQKDKAMLNKLEAKEVEILDLDSLKSLNDDVSKNTDKTEVKEQDQEKDQTHNENDDLGIDKILQPRKNK